MNEFKNRIANLKHKQLLLLADQLNTRLEKSNLTATEPLAVIGLGCRFPGGANNPTLYWDLLTAGREGICEVPPERWNIDAYYDPDPDMPGKMNTRWGGFIDKIDRFDADFFGISPREAITMDPQQRLLLEVAWETFEHANLNPQEMNESSTGVFVGICNSDYFQMQMQGGGFEVDAYLATGNAHSIASGRISYSLGLQGPSLSVDTACSSSLVAVHLACQSLRTGECRLALAGGVNLILSPEITIALSKSHMMSASGRCKTFDKDADGFVRGEGCGMIALKRLSDAESDGDNILALILGSAANQDGRSSGITAPNGPSQAAVIQKALKNSGLKPAAIDYIEAHGTGTSLGDPIEIGAIADVFGKSSGRSEPLLVGSVKTNIGHSESAAGIAGLIKLILAVNKGEVPPNLHFQNPNPAIDWDRLSVRIPVKLEPWPRLGDRRIGGVSSFGFSGTNAHIIIGEAPVSPSPVQRWPEGRQLIAISAQNDRALNELAGRYADFLKQAPETSMSEIARILAAGRAHHSCRAAFTARSKLEVSQKLDDLMTNTDAVGINRGTAGKHAIQPVFLFTGQGSQYPGMGLTLYETQPVFRDTLNRCDELLYPIIGKRVKELLEPAPSIPSELNQTRFTQPVLFALEYALACQWRDWGIEPAAIMGHSVGEYVGACIAGIFSLEDGLRLIARRGELMQQLPESGTMAAVSAPVEKVQTFFDEAEGAVCVAAINSPYQTVISGDRNSLMNLLEAMGKDGIRCQTLQVSHAFHSHLMAPMLDALALEAASVKFSLPQIPIISNLTGTFVEDDTMCQPEYWCKHTRRTVQFSSGIKALFFAGHKNFLEIGPQPVLTALGQQCLPEEPVKWYASMRKGEHDEQEILQGLGALYVDGANVRWNRAVPSVSGVIKTRLPSYPFQRKSYWIKSDRPQMTPAAVSSSADNRNEHDHRLLGRYISSPALSEIVFESQLSSTGPVFMNHHRVFGHCIMPTPAYLEMAMALSNKTGDWTHTSGWDIRDIRIEQALIFPEDETITVQTLYAKDGNGECRFFSRAPFGGENEWHRHATCRIQRLGSQKPSGTGIVDIKDLRTRCVDEVPVHEFYQRLAGLGLEFGSSFRGIKRILKGDHEALGEMVAPDELVQGWEDFSFHPALLDACFHLLGAAIGESLEDSAYLLIGMDRFRLYRPPPSHFWNLTRISSTGQRSESFSGDILLFNDNLQVIGEFTNLLLKRTDQSALPTTQKKALEADLLYSLRWHDKPVESATTANESELESPPGSPVERLSECLKVHAKSFGVEVYGSLLPQLDRYCVAAVIQMMQAAGISLIQAESWTRKRLEEHLGVIPRYRRLLDRMMDMLVEENLLREEQDAFVVAMESPLPVPAVSAEELVRSHPACEPEIRLTERCAGRLLEVLRGQCDPLELLFPNGQLTSLEKIYRDSPYARTFNSTLADAVVSEIALREKKDQPIRILEIGAGTGGTTALLLPLLAGKTYDYLFTDITPLFLARARENFGSDPLIRFETLDIEKDPDEQGFSGRRFDIVIAANVLHATKNLRETTAHVEKLMAPGATLILLEGTAPQRWVDLTFGLTEGWWRFEDEALRPDYALIDRYKWEKLLADNGLNPCSIALDESHPEVGMLPQVLVLARKSVEDSGPDLKPHAWIVVNDNGGKVCEALLSGIEAGGDEILKVIGNDRHSRRPEDTGASPFNGKKGFGGLIEQALDISDDRPLSVVYFWDAPEPETPDTKLADGLKPVLRDIQDLIAVSPHHSGRLKLWFVTIGAQPILLSNPAGTPFLSSIWGFIRVFALEQPQIFGGIVDLDPESEAGEAVSCLLMQIKSDDGEDQSIFRFGRRYVPRIERAEGTATNPDPVKLYKKATYLITGGLGGLGLKIAEWMSQQGAGKILLVSRKTLPPRAEWHDVLADAPMASYIKAIQKIEECGADVETISADAGDRVAMERLFARLREDRAYPLRGIVHAAVQMSASSLETLTEEDLEEMMRGKAKGALLMDEFSRGMKLDFFTMFSSTTSLWGVAGLAHYAAANQVQDALAHRRHSESLPGVSINWGTWEEMRIADAKDKETFLQAGLRPIPVHRALSLLGRFLGHPEPQVCIADVNWPRLLDIYEARRKRPLFEKVSSFASKPKPASAPTAPCDSGNFKRTLETTSKDRWPDMLTMHLKRLVQQVLQIESADEVVADRGLFEMGMDSLMAVELKGHIEKDTGLSLPSTLIFNYPTIDDLTGFLLEQLSPKEQRPVPIVKPDIKPEPETSSDIDSLTEDQLTELLIERLKELK